MSYLIRAVLLIGIMSMGGCELTDYSEDCSYQTINFTVRVQRHANWADWTGEAIVVNARADEDFLAEIRSQLDVYRKFNCAYGGEIYYHTNNLNFGFDASYEFDTNAHTLMGSMTYSLPTFSYILADSNSDRLVDDFIMTGDVKMSVSEGDILVVNFGNTSLTYSKN